MKYNTNLVLPIASVTAGGSAISGALLCLYGMGQIRTWAAESELVNG